MKIRWAVQNFKIALKPVFIPWRLFIWHSSGGIVRTNWKQSDRAYKNKENDSDAWSDCSQFILTIPADDYQIKSLRGMNTLFKTISKFCTANQLFKYLRQRYNHQQITCLNKLIRTRGCIQALVSKTAFSKANIAQRTLLKSVNFWIKKSRAFHRLTIERAFMHDEIEQNQSMIVFLKNKYRLIWQEVRQFLSFFDLPLPFIID